MAEPVKQNAAVVVPGEGRVVVGPAPGLKNWKIMIFGFIIAGLGTIQAADIATIVPQQWVGLVMTAIGAVVMLLRAWSSGPAFSNVEIKDKDPL